MELMLEEDCEVTQSSQMLDYYRDKVVLLTGGTGFLGCLFVEKLLRSGVKCLYLIVRQKKGKSPQERVSLLFSGVVFQKLKAIDPNYLQRIRVVEGDLDEEKFEISTADMTDIHQNVQILIHAAANVNFDDDLGLLIRNNVKGTKEVLQMCEQIQNLEVFAYISTAYSHCHRKDIDEKFYKAPIDLDAMFRLVEKYGDTEEFKILQAQIIKPWPNNYTYSKALAEEVVRRWSNTRIPTCIIRPTIVISTAEDPVIGWTNNTYGLNGVALAVGLGAVRLLWLDLNSVGDLVCADFVINSTLAAIWTTNQDHVKKASEVLGSESCHEPKIYHVSSTKDSPVTWGEVKNGLFNSFQEYPAKRMLWKSSLHATQCPIIMKIFSFYYHIIPAFVFDFFLNIKNSKLRILPMRRKAERFMVVIEYFMSREWNFSNDNMRSVISRMNSADQKVFPCDIRKWKWSEYCVDYMHGLKLYMMKETMNDVVEARRNLKKLIIIHYVFLVFYYSFHLAMFYSIFNYYGLLGSVEHRIRDIYDLIQNRF